MQQSPDSCIGSQQYFRSCMQHHKSCSHIHVPHSTAQSRPITMRNTLQCTPVGPACNSLLRSLSLGHPQPGPATGHLHSPTGVFACISSHVTDLLHGTCNLLMHANSENILLCLPLEPEDGCCSVQLLEYQTLQPTPCCYMRLV